MITRGIGAGTCVRISKDNQRRDHGWFGNHQKKSSNNAGRREKLDLRLFGT